LWALPCGPLAGALTPPAGQDDLTTQPQPSAQFQTPLAQLQTQGETRQGRVDNTSHTSRQPPSAEAPFHQRKGPRKTSSGHRGGPQGHPGKGPPWLSPTAVHLLAPGLCPWGPGHLVSLTPSDTQQGIAWPPLELEGHHCILQPGQCQGGGRPRKAPGPSDSQAGSGPRFRALSAALAGRPRPAGRLRQDFGHAGFHIPRSRGAVPKGIPRVSPALVPHQEAMAT
jgi:hypothetical protein